MNFKENGIYSKWQIKDSGSSSSWPSLITNDVIMTSLLLLNITNEFASLIFYQTPY